MTAYVFLSTLLLGGILFACVSATPWPKQQPVRIRSDESDTEH